MRSILRTADIPVTHRNAGEVLKKPAVNRLIYVLSDEYPIEPANVHSHGAPSAADLRERLADLCGFEYAAAEYPRPFRVAELEHVLETLREHTEDEPHD